MLGFVGGPGSAHTRSLIGALRSRSKIKTRVSFPVAPIEDDEEPTERCDSCSQYVHSLRLCGDCGNDACDECMDRCRECRGWSCCLRECGDCGRNVCSDCNYYCESCDESYCLDHIERCDCCDESFCNSCHTEHFYPHGRCDCGDPAVEGCDGECEDCYAPNGRCSECTLRLSEDEENTYQDWRSTWTTHYTGIRCELMCAACLENTIAPHGRCTACQEPLAEGSRCYPCAIIYRTLEQCSAYQSPLFGRCIMCWTTIPSMGQCPCCNRFYHPGTGSRLLLWQGGTSVWESEQETPIETQSTRG